MPNSTEYPISEVRIRLDRIHAYKLAYTKAEHSYNLYKVAVGSTNRVIELLERKEACRALAARLTKLNNEIRIAQKGIQEATGVLADDDTDVSQESIDQRMLAKRMGRVLMQRVHPDAGGNVDIFNRVVDAIKRGDVVMLQYMIGTITLSRNLTWQCNDGVPHMLNIASVYASRLSKLRSHKLASIATLYLSGKKEKAESIFIQYLKFAITNRSLKLQALLTQESHRGKN